MQNTFALRAEDIFGEGKKKEISGGQGHEGSRRSRLNRNIASKIEESFFAYAGGVDQSTIIADRVE